MRMPVVCLVECLRHFLGTYRDCFSQPQYKYFVIILLGLMLCQGTRTLSGLLRQVEGGATLSGVSRFMSEAPWSEESLAQRWQQQFRQEMVGQVRAEHARQRRRQPKRRGRPKKTRFWASSDLDAELDTLVTYIATRWDVEVLFADTKELLGLDHYQMMSATAIRRFWTLVMLAYFFLDQVRDRQLRESGQHTTIGDAWRQVQHTHWCHFIDWMHQKFKFGYQPADLYQELTGASL